MSVPVDMKNRYNTVVLARIKPGKSLFFQTPFIIKKKDILLVIISILALLKDQLQSIKKQGLFVTALTSNIIAVNAQGWKSVKIGAYSIILASHEILLHYTSIYILHTVKDRSSAFTKKPACITINKAHLIWSRRMLQKKYKIEA